MFNLRKEIIPGRVVWANRNIYYDEPNRQLFGKRSMYLITKVNTDYFFGCPLTASQSRKNGTLLSKEYYPIKRDSRVTECLYKLTYDDVASFNMFTVTDRTFAHFKRELYKKIVLGHADSPDEYNEIFVKDYLDENHPKVGNIIVYPSLEKVFKYYYINAENDENYIVFKANKNGYNYIVDNPIQETIPKSVRFFDYYDKCNIELAINDEESVSSKVKILGSSIDIK